MLAGIGAAVLLIDGDDTDAGAPQHKDVVRKARPDVLNAANPALAGNRKLMEGLRDAAPKDARLAVSEPGDKLHDVAGDWCRPR